MRTAHPDWLEAHPHLEPIARFQRLVDEVAALGPRRHLELPSPEAYAVDRAAGVPLLRSRPAGADLAAAAAEALADLAARLAATPLPGDLAEACGEIAEELRLPERRSLVAEWLSGGSEAEPPSAHPGLLRFLCWKAARRVLAPVVEGSTRSSEEGWGRGWCPTCGALPLSAQVIPGVTARQRFLACGCCGTRWRYPRIGCPFCGTEAQERLGILQPEGEERLRIDVCSECKGYVKTYTDEGDEALFLADWPTLHLDVLALDRGYQRVGASLYELPKDERRIEP